MISRFRDFIDKKPYIALGIVLLMQVLLIIFWGCMKSNFHQDELFSLESAHYINDTTPSGCYMHESELFAEKTWLDVGDFRELLTVDDDSSILSDDADSIAHKFVLGRSYMILLNLAVDFLSPGEISKWPGIILNIPFFLIMQICLYKVIYGLTKERKVSLLYIGAYGFSSISIGFGIYTRFYCYALMLIALAIFLHYKIWFDDKKSISIIAFEIVAFVSFVLAFRASELCAFLAFSWFCLFAVGLFIKKKWKIFILYVSPALFGVIFLAKYFSNFSYALINPAKYMDGSGQPIDIMFTNAVNMSTKILIKRIYFYLECLGNSILGNIFFLLFIIIIGVWLGILFIKNKKIGIIPYKTKEFGFCLILSGMVVCYSIFSIIVGLWLPRYYALMYPQLLMIIVLILWYLLKYTKKVYNYLVISVFVMGLLYSNLFGLIDNVYLDDREAIASIKEHESVDNVIWNLDDFQIILECTYLNNEESRMYVVSEYEELPYSDFGEDFLLWTCISEPLSDKAIEDLNSNGYEVTSYLGIAADANIYYCEAVD